MSDIEEQTTTKFSSREILSTTEYRVATPEELEDVLGITDSSNKTDILISSSGDFILQKGYKEIEERVSGINPRTYAETEVDILGYLASQQTSTEFSKLEKNTITTDQEGLPTVLIKMNPDYLPLAGDRSFFTSILREEKPQRLSSVVKAIHEMHDLNVMNGDLHLNNIGEVPADTEDEETNVMIIDFELGKREKNKPLSEDDIVQDLSRFGDSMLRRYSESAKPLARNKYISIVSEQYPDIDIQNLQRKISTLQY